MRVRATVITFLGLALCLLTLQVSSAQDAKKGTPQKGTPKETPKEAPKEAPKKFQGAPKDAIEGTVKAVDMAKSAFTLTLKDKKDRTFAVDKATEFWGPKGGDRGTGPEGLKDDCMATGYEIHVVPTKDGKTAKDVFLPERKPDTKKK